MNGEARKDMLDEEGIPFLPGFVVFSEASARDFVFPLLALFADHQNHCAQLHIADTTHIAQTDTIPADLRTLPIYYLCIDARGAAISGICTEDGITVTRLRNRVPRNHHWNCYLESRTMARLRNPQETDS